VRKEHSKCSEISEPFFEKEADCDEHDVEVNSDERETQTRQDKQGRLESQPQEHDGAQRHILAHAGREQGPFDPL
jgi:hypothetical protein